MFRVCLRRPNKQGDWGEEDVPNRARNLVVGDGEGLIPGILLAHIKHGNVRRFICYVWPAQAVLAIRSPPSSSSGLRLVFPNMGLAFPTCEDGLPLFYAALPS